MSWALLKTEILSDYLNFHNQIKSLAPQNSSYRSKEKGRLVDYIYVDGKRVRTNTNNLFNSITYIQEDYAGSNMIFKTVVDTSRVPYYDKAVLQPYLTVAFHYGRTEYGDTRYAESSTTLKENRNYLYYLKGQNLMTQLISKYNGRVVETDESIGDFK